MQKYSNLYTIYKNLYEEQEKAKCLQLLGENGFCIPNTLLKDINNNSNRRQKVLDNYLELKNLNYNDWLINEIQYPEAECAIYDLSGRIETKEKSLNDIICSINYLIPAHNIYMYNPIGCHSGYNYYCGQKVIVYQITDEMTDLEKVNITKEIKRTTIKDYNINDPLYYVYKIIIVTTNWNSKYDWLRFDLGIDSDNFGRLFIDAWNGEQHIWTYKDGSYISSEERLAILTEKVDKPNSFEPLVKSEKKPRKPRKPRKSNKKRKQRKLVGFDEI